MSKCTEIEDDLRMVNCIGDETEKIWQHCKKCVCWMICLIGMEECNVCKMNYI